MNINQFNLIAEKLIKSINQRRAVMMVAIDGETATYAEIRVHGRVTNTVGRDAKKIQNAYKFAVKVSNAD